VGGGVSDFIRPPRNYTTVRAQAGIPAF